MRRVLVLAILLLPPGVQPGNAVVEYRTFQVSPDTLRVPVGTTVRWTNHDQVLHTVTGGTPQEPGKGWREVLGKAGATATRTFRTPGSYRYFCDRHPFMTGTIIVTSTPR